MVELQFLHAMLGSLIGASIPLLLMYRLRVRMLRSTLRWMAKAAPDEFQDLVLGTILTWKEEKDPKTGELVRAYTPKPLLVNFIASVAPVAVTIFWQTFTKILPGLQGMTVGPDGRPQMNMLMGPMKKLAEGKKVKFDDFIPVIVEKMLPFAEKFTSQLSNMFGGPSTPAGPGTARAGKPPSGGFNPG